MDKGTEEREEGIIAQIRAASTLDWTIRFHRVKELLIEDATRMRALALTSTAPQDKVSFSGILTGVAATRITAVELSALLLEWENELYEKVTSLQDGMDKVTKALEGINAWMAKFEPFLQDAIDNQRRYMKP